MKNYEEWGARGKEHTPPPRLRRTVKGRGEPIPAMTQRRHGVHEAVSSKARSNGKMPAADCRLETADWLLKTV